MALASMAMRSTETSASDRASWFTTTRWTVIVAARKEGTPMAQEALEHLCHVYWPPLYAYVRRRGYQPTDAQDLTQGFFCHLLSHHLIEASDPLKGKFRTFLLASLNHYLQNSNAAAHALKRGGGLAHLSFEDLEMEEKYQAALAASGKDTPERVFDRRWALQLGAQSRARLRHLYEQDGKLMVYERLEQFLATEATAAQYQTAALALEMTPGAVRTAVYRLRHRYGELMHREIARTVSNDLEAQAECAYLKELLADGFDTLPLDRPDLGPPASSR